jgi:hypothetical protein
MTDAYVIEIDEDAIGLVVREASESRAGKGYRFYASVKHYQSLEGKLFPNPESARRSAKVLFAERLKSVPVLTDPVDNLINQPHQMRFSQIKPIDLPAAC